MENLKSIYLRSPNNSQWMIRVLDDKEKGTRNLYTQMVKVDEGENYIKDEIYIKNPVGKFKIKISNEGQLVTYPLEENY